jgi:hypothetical protein
LMDALWHLLARRDAAGVRLAGTIDLFVRSRAEGISRAALVDATSHLGAVSFRELLARPHVGSAEPSLIPPSKPQGSKGDFPCE